MKSRQKKSTNKILTGVFCVSLVMVLSLSFSNEVLADTGGGTGSVQLQNPLCGGSPNCTFANILKTISNYLVTLSGIIVVIMILIGAFQIMTAGGDPEKVKTGRHTILWSAVGFAIVLSAYGIVAIVEELLK
ncbi:MAG: pilin [Patescibacteria group bacterium]